MKKALWRQWNIPLGLHPEWKRHDFMKDSLSK